MEESYGNMIPQSDNLSLDCPEELVSVFGPTDPSTPEAVVYTDVSIVPEHNKEGLELTISKLQEEISALRSKRKGLDGKRREELNKLLDIKGSIRVFCRVRSSLSSSNRKIQSPISTGMEKVTVRSTGAKKEFGLDRVFPQGTTQDDVFLEVEPILRSALDGHNVCIFAYGQTGTGKTFTMEGTNGEPGLVPRAVEELFRRASEEKSTSFTLSMSMLEVYMGGLRDLLTNKQSSAKCGLSILSSSNGSVEIEGLKDVAIADFKQANRWYTKGKRARSTSWTNVNEASSRSHCLTRITIARSGDMEVSKLWMVDLGGSERLLKTGATGQTLDEGKAINLSLSALGDVIAALRRRRNHIPYRNSKLTQILSDSLGDGSKVLLIVHISPSEDDVGESICSLSFAKRVRAIEPNKEISEDSKKHKEKCITELDQQINDTEEELLKVDSQIEKIEKLVQEKKQLFPIAYQLLEDQKGSPRSPLIVGHQEITETPRTAEKAAPNARPGSVPRFMTSTVCSRQRLNPTEEVGRVRLRTLTSGIKGSVDFMGSQSLSYSDPYFKSNLRNLKSKLVTYETNISKHRRDLPLLANQENPSCNSTDSKTSSLARNRKISTSHPSLRATLHQHRRRMSDLT